MPIELTSLTSLNEADVLQNDSEASQRVQEVLPNVSADRGYVHDTVIHPHGLLATLLQTNTNRYLASRSLIEISADPTLADDDIVNAVMSNWGIARSAGGFGSGLATVIVSQAATVIIPAGAIFTFGDQQFTTQSVVVAKPEASLIDSPSDQLLVPLINGNFAFSIALTASVAGPAGNIIVDSPLTPATQPTNFVLAYASQDFIGGLAPDTNAQLIAKQAAGVAAKVPCNETNARALLQQNALYSTFVGLSVIGMGDPEMQRDKHWTWPIGGGGRTDWYYRPQASLLRTTITVTATLVDVLDVRDSVWQFSLNRDQAAGVYEIGGVRPLDATVLDGSFQPSSDIRQLDFTGTGPFPDVVNLIEGAYSRYQTIAIQFQDTLTATAGLIVGAQAQYTVELRLMPLVASLQDFLMSDEISPFGSDILVRSPMPCFVEVWVSIAKNAASAAIDVSAIQNDVAARVNAIPFVGGLYASMIQSAVQGHLDGTNAAVSGIDMIGRLRYPDGTVRWLRDDSLLQVKDDPAFCVTKNTTQFFCDASDVVVSFDAAPSL